MTLKLKHCQNEIKSDKILDNPLTSTWSCGNRVNITLCRWLVLVFVPIRLNFSGWLGAGYVGFLCRCPDPWLRFCCFISWILSGRLSRIICWAWCHRLILHKILVCKNILCRIFIAKIRVTQTCFNFSRVTLQNWFLMNIMLFNIRGIILYAHLNCINPF